MKNARGGFPSRQIESMFWRRTFLKYFLFLKLNSSKRKKIRDFFSSVFVIYHLVAIATCLCHFQISNLPDWLVHHHSRLEGIPATRDVITTNHIYITFDDFSKKQCDVIVSDDVINYARAPRRRGLRCTSSEPITVIAMTLIKPPLGGAVELIRSLSELTNQEIVVEEEKIDESHHWLLSDSSDVDDAVDGQVNVWWPVACGSDTLSTGQLGRLLGLVKQKMRVVNWQLGSRKDAKARFAAHSLPSTEVKISSRSKRENAIWSSGDFPSSLSYLQSSTTSVLPFDGHIKVRRSQLRFHAVRGSFFWGIVPDDCFETTGFETFSLLLIPLPFSGSDHITEESWLKFDEKGELFGMTPSTNRNYVSDLHLIFIWSSSDLHLIFI